MVRWSTLSSCNILLLRSSLARTCGRFYGGFYCGRHQTFPCCVWSLVSKVTFFTLLWFCWLWFFLYWLAFTELHHPQRLVHSCGLQETFINCCLPRHWVDGYQKENWTHCRHFGKPDRGRYWYCIRTAYQRYRSAWPKCILMYLITIQDKVGFFCFDWVSSSSAGRVVTVWYKLKKQNTHCWLLMMLYLHFLLSLKLRILWKIVALGATVVIVFHNVVVFLCCRFLSGVVSSGSSWVWGQCNYRPLSNSHRKQKHLSYPWNWHSRDSLLLLWKNVRHC